jgi:microcystin-dependent protein
MATLNITNSFSNGTTADALQVNQNFTDVKSFVESNVVHVDGSVKAGVSALDFALTGIIVPYVGAAAPTGWLLCRGQLVSKATYAALYSAVGPNAFGTDTSTDFYLPNLQGRVPVGVSTTDTDFDRADVGGAKSVTLTSAQSGLVGHNHTQNPHSHTQNAHTHLVNGTVISGTHNHDNLNDYLSVGTNGGLINGSQSPNALTTAQPGISSDTATNNAVASANASEAHTNLQPYIALNFIVKT